MALFTRNYRHTHMQYHAFGSCATPWPIACLLSTSFLAELLRLSSLRDVFFIELRYDTNTARTLFGYDPLCLCGLPLWSPSPVGPQELSVVVPRCPGCLQPWRVHPRSPYFQALRRGRYSNDSGGANVSGYAEPCSGKCCNRDCCVEGLSRSSLIPVTVY